MLSRVNHQTAKSCRRSNSDDKNAEYPLRVQRTIERWKLIHFEEGKDDSLGKNNLGEIDETIPSC